jgi:hypothetical protein
MKSVLRFAAAAFLAAAALPAHAGSPDAAASAPIGPEAAWTPPADFRARFRAACDGSGRGLGACFLAQMQKAGASPAAVAFARGTGSQGYMTRFRAAGLVDVAYVEYPFRANQNQLVFLVNGEPPLVDVDEISRLRQAGLDANPAYMELKRAYPKVALFPGDRSNVRLPRSLGHGAGRGQRFVVVYELRDGCHACAIVGEARIGFAFDAHGRFVGTEVEQVRPRAGSGPPEK